MYKLSKFNIVLNKKDKFCIYNSLSGQIALIENEIVKSLLISKKY